MPEAIDLPARRPDLVRLPDDVHSSGSAEACTALWQAVLVRLQDDPTISRASFAGWLRETRLLEHDGDNFLVAAQHSFARDRLERSFRVPIERAIAHCTGRPGPRANFTVGPGERARRALAEPRPVAKEGGARGGGKRAWSHTPEAGSIASDVVRVPLSRVRSSSAAVPTAPQGAARHGTSTFRNTPPGHARGTPNVGGGDVASLGSLAARVAIVRARAAVLRAALADPVLELIARRVEGGVAQLEAALARVVAAAQRAQAPLALTEVEATLRERGISVPRVPSQPEAVLHAVARCSGVPAAELAGKRRDRDVVLPRQVAMYLMREETGASLNDIGEVLGGRDHTTVLHGCEKIAQALTHDAHVRRLVEAARQGLLDSRGDSSGRALDSGHLRPA
jgi:chromosomal replication initiation ATPase DnaA